MREIDLDALEIDLDAVWIELDALLHIFNITGVWIYRKERNNSIHTKSDVMTPGYMNQEDVSIERSVGMSHFDRNKAVTIKYCDPDFEQHAEENNTQFFSIEARFKEYLTV